MTQAELALFLETLAELVRCKAKNANEAADILDEKAQKLKAK